VHELVTVFGILVILAGLVLANSQLRRESLKEKYDRYRRELEQKRGTMGLQLIKWDLLRKTRGNVRSGPTFDKALLPYQDQLVDLMGFMVPIAQFVDMTEFLVLPVPIQCYFCEAPPMRDVVLVHMDEGKETPLVNEPVVVSGILHLNQGPGTKFFYTIKKADVNAGEVGKSLTRKEVPVEHRIPQHIQNGEELLEGVELPTSEAPAPSPIPMGQ
jgi:hypothetical protein